MLKEGLFIIHAVGINNDYCVNYMYRINDTDLTGAYRYLYLRWLGGGLPALLSFNGGTLLKRTSAHARLPRYEYCST